MNKKIFKTAVSIVAISLMVSVPGSIVKGAGSGAEEGVAGIALSLNQYRKSSTMVDELVDLDIQVVKAEKALSEYLRDEIIYPHAGMAISIADSYVNIRSEANSESEVLGKLYRGLAANVLNKDGEWVHIESGEVVGYVSAEYLAIGKEADEYMDEFASINAIVKAETLRVRQEQNTEATTLTLVAGGESFKVTEEYEDWVEILIEGEEGDDYTGFVSKDLVEVKVEFEYAITIEEENRIIAEEEARRAEEERRIRLAEEEAAKAEKARRDAEARKAAEAKKAAAKKKDKSKKPQSSSGSSTGTKSGNGQEIASYALNFIGNPYQWAGTSLTNGADCSGFVQSVYRKFGYSIPRDSRSQAVGAGVQVNVSDRRPGDLIFYTKNGRVNHVGIYIGGGKVVHASNPRDGVKVSNYNYRPVYRVRRVIR